MNLLEYQAKELFRQVGIPVLPSQRIDRPADLKGLKIPYPIVLKSQVHATARGKVGGIRFAENTIDAVAAAQTIFRLPIQGEYPQVLLAEAKYDSDRELYLAITLDTSSRRPVLLGSQRGGVDVESRLEQMRQVVVDQEFSPFYARRLALKMGLSGPLIQAVSTVVEKMYWLFVERDLDLIEINPLAVSPTGDVMALDGIVTINDAALGRQMELLSTLNRTPVAQASTSAVIDPTAQLRCVSMQGTIGVLCDGAGLTMATLDLLRQANGAPAGFVDLGGECRFSCPPSQLSQRLHQALDLLLRDKNMKVVLINIVGSVVSCLDIANELVRYINRYAVSQQMPSFVVRLAGHQFHAARGVLSTLQIPLVETLDQAIALSVSLSQPEGQRGQREGTPDRPTNSTSLLLASA